VTVRIGFIGAGHVVRTRYLPVIRKNPNVSVLGFASRTSESAQELSDEFEGARAYSTYNELLRAETLDAVFVCTPNHLHYDITKEALNHEKHVFLEKPVCSTFEDSRDLILFASEQSPVFYVSANNNFRPENRWLIETIRNREDFRPELLNLTWYRAMKGQGKNWLYNQSLSGGGVVMDLGYHMIHLALSMFPERSRFTAYGNAYYHREEENRVEDTFTGVVKIDDQITLNLQLAWDAKVNPSTQVNIHVLGEQGEYSPLDYPGSTSHKGFPDMLSDFVSCIQQDKQPDISCPLDTMQLIKELYRSDAENQSVENPFASNAGELVK